MLAPTGSALSAWLAEWCDDPSRDTIALGNRARRLFVSIYGEEAAAMLTWLRERRGRQAA